uniref:Uncharacterized protein n=2 Tax=Emiliania huxleyi TaxID=2903 RepID=A0A7S3WSD0_EMIHU
MKRATWRSARQHVKAVRTCDTERLEQSLAEAAAAFPGCAERVLAVLIHVRAFSLADALDCMKAAGFRVGHALLTLEVFLSSSHAHDGRQSEARLTLADFELAFTFWDKLEDAVKAWLSVSFVRVWQSPAGAGLPGPLLFRLKELWQHTPPTAKQRLPPARACGLGRSKEETFDLLDSHVDLNGDTTALVGELLSRGFLPPDETLGRHGLIGGLVWTRPELAAERLLAGTIALDKPQPTIARALAAAIAGSSSELTDRAVKHFGRFVDLLSESLPQSTNAALAMAGPLLAVAARLKEEERRPILGALSGIYLGPAPGETRVAEVVHPRAAALAWFTNRTVLQPSYEIFLDTAIRAISLRELVGAVRPVESFRVSRGFQERLHAWALAQLERRDATSTQQLLQFLTRWLVKLCTAEQVVTWWLRAVDAANSWSFLLASLPAASAASECDERLHARVAELLEGDTCATPARADAVLLAFAALWPQKVLSQVGIAAWLPLSRRRASPPPSVVSGTLASARTAESAAHINDALAPEAEMARVLAAHPLMHKTKTKREFEQLEDWVLRLEPRLLRAAPVQARLVELLCATWSDRARLLVLCEKFAFKLLVVSETETAPRIAPADIASLVTFLRKCPHLGGKHDFLKRQLARYASASTGGGLKLAPLLPLLEAFAPTAEALIDLLHALLYFPLFEMCNFEMCNDVVDPPVVALLYRLLAAEEEAERRVLLLRSCRFRTPPPPERDECVDSEAFEAAATAAATAGTGVAVATPDVGDAPPPLDLPCPLFRHFGPHGEAVVLEYLRSASPKSLVKLFGGGGEAEAQQEGAAFAKLCGVAMRSWRLAACRLEEVADVLTVVGWFPEARSRCAPLVWGAGDDSGRFEALTVESQVEQHTAQVRQVLASTPPDLGALPRKWWHCVPWGRCTEADLAQLVGAGVEVPLSEVGFAARGWPTQQLLLEAHADDVAALVEFAPQAEGPIGVYLQRVFELLPASDSLLRKLGDGVEDEERLQSGWNQLLHTLLAKIKLRIREQGNPLHSEEQLLLFGGCATRLADPSNSTLLADLMEAKLVDPSHIFELIKFVLGCKYVPNQSGLLHVVRDSALRAMMRLDKGERDELHRTLLQGRESALPLQVLFSLAVTELDASVQPLVVRQTERLDADGWLELLSLVKDANPVSGKVHTFPRSLGPLFAERFLARYLRDDPTLPPRHPHRAARDARYYLLFVACTPPAGVARYVLGMLAGQRHELDDMLLGSLADRMSGAEFREVIEYIQPSAWPSRLQWALTCVAERGEASRCRERPRAPELSRD